MQPPQPHQPAPAPPGPPGKSRKRRLALLALGGVLVLAGAAVWLDPTRVVIGALRGDRFYRSRPTRYWRDRLSDPEPGARSGAVKDLADGGASAVPVLVELLQGAGPAEVRWTAASVLGKIGPDAGAAVPALVAALDDPEPMVRDLSAEALGHVGPSAAGAAAGPLSGLLKGDGRLSALQALQRFGKEAAPGVPAVAAALGHPDAAVRWNAAEVLAKVGPAGTPPCPPWCRCWRTTAPRSAGTLPRPSVR